MNPIVIWRILAAVGALVGVGGSAYGVDQHLKRRKEQAANRIRLREIEARLASMEQELRQLLTKLDQKNEQVRSLAAEIVRLRNAANDLRCMA